MSMNLHCTNFELPQIPTYMSYLIYSNGDGGNKGVAYRLEQYIRMNIQDAHNDRFKYKEGTPEREGAEDYLSSWRDLLKEFLTFKEENSNLFNKFLTLELFGVW